MNKMTHEDVEQFREMVEELQEKVGELKDFVDHFRRGSMAMERADAYWVSQLQIALSNDHGYLASAGTNAEETLGELEEELEGEPEEEDDEDEEDEDDQA